MISFKEIVKGILLRTNTSDPTDNLAGSIWYNSATNRIKAYIESAIRIFVTEDQAQTLTNKTIDASSNTLTNITATSLSSGFITTTIDGSSTDSQVPSAKAAYTYTNSTVNNHINNPTGAHAATAISYGASNVGAALDFLEASVGSSSIIAGTASLLANQTNTNLISVAAYKTAFILIHIATPTLYESFQLQTTKRAASYKMSIDSVGDVSGISFNITAAGMLQYTSGAETATLSYSILKID
jgi:hypothetical protein